MAPAYSRLISKAITDPPSNLTVIYTQPTTGEAGSTAPATFPSSQIFYQLAGGTIIVLVGWFQRKGIHKIAAFLNNKFQHWWAGDSQQARRAIILESADNGMEMATLATHDGNAEVSARTTLPAVPAAIHHNGSTQQLQHMDQVVRPTYSATNPQRSQTQGVERLERNVDKVAETSNEGETVIEDVEDAMDDFVDC